MYPKNQTLDSKEARKHLLRLKGLADEHRISLRDDEREFGSGVLGGGCHAQQDPTEPATQISGQDRRSNAPVRAIAVFDASTITERAGGKRSQLELIGLIGLYMDRFESPRAAIGWLRTHREELEAGLRFPPMLLFVGTSDIDLQTRREVHDLGATYKKLSTPLSSLEELEQWTTSFLSVDEKVALNKLETGDASAASSDPWWQDHERETRSLARAKLKRH